MFLPSSRSCPSRPSWPSSRCARVACLFLCLLIAACGSQSQVTKPAQTADWFTESAQASGLDFTHFNGMSGHFYYPEIMAPGVALLDYDNDGDLDVYVTQGQMLSVDGKTPPPAGTPVLKDHLFRNDLVVNADGTRTVHFTDVTDQAGINLQTYGMGVAAGDFDNDGFVDIYRTSLNGATLLRNNGNGTFEDVTARALVGGAYGPTLGVSTADFNNDGWIDLYVANDSQPNQLWINQHNGTFKDTAFLAGAAVSGTGQAEASMGVDAGDVDNDGDEDLIVTNWLDQMNAFYLNDGSGNFEDRRAASGLGAPSLAKTGFGAAWFDFDRDGWLDLFVANGGVATIEALARAHDPFPLKMTPQLYR